MSTKDLIRFSGLMSILAGLLFALGTLIHPAREDAATVLNTTPQLLTSHWLFVASFVPMQLGLVGLYVSQAQQTGRLGLVGFFLTFTGTLLLSTTGFYGFILPLLATQEPALVAGVLSYTPVVVLTSVNVLTFFPGLMLFGYATMRSRVLPREGGLLLILGSPLLIIGGLAVVFASTDALYVIAIIGSGMISVGFIRLGYALWSGKRQDAVQPN